MDLKSIYVLKLKLYVFQRSLKRATIHRISRDGNGITRYLQNSCHAIKRNHRSHRRLTLLTVSMTLTFYISWAPYALTSFLTIIGHSLPHLPNVIAILLAKSGTVINPILYIFLNNDVSICKIKRSAYYLSSY